MTREHGDMKWLCTIMLLEEAKGMLDTKAFLTYWYRVGSPAGATIPVKRSVSLKAKAEAEIFVLSVPV